MTGFLLYSQTHTHTHTKTAKVTQCSWHGELIKMMFSLRGALRFFALLWLFNLLFAMLVIAFTHSSPIFRNGSSNSHTHTFAEQFRFLHMEFFTFLWVYFESQTLSVRLLTIGNTHHHQQKKKEKRGDEWQWKINFAKHQIEKLILQDSCSVNWEMWGMDAEYPEKRDVSPEILIDTEFNYKILVILKQDYLNWEVLRG